MMRRSKKVVYRCREQTCRHKFTKPETPTKATILKCPKCGSDDIEFVSIPS